MSSSENLSLSKVSENDDNETSNSNDSGGGKKLTSGGRAIPDPDYLKLLFDSSIKMAIHIDNSYSSASRIFFLILISYIGMVLLDKQAKIVQENKWLFVIGIVIFTLIFILMVYRSYMRLVSFEAIVKSIHGNHNFNNIPSPFKPVLKIPGMRKEIELRTAYLWISIFVISCVAAIFVTFARADMLLKDANAARSPKVCQDGVEALPSVIPAEADTQEPQDQSSARH